MTEPTRTGESAAVDNFDLRDRLARAICSSVCKLRNPPVVPEAHAREVDAVLAILLTDEGWMALEDEYARQHGTLSWP